MDPRWVSFTPALTLIETDATNQGQQCVASRTVAWRFPMAPASQKRTFNIAVSNCGINGPFADVRVIECLKQNRFS